jgi:hypothetical protein
MSFVIDSIDVSGRQKFPIDSYDYALIIGPYDAWNNKQVQSHDRLSDTWPVKLNLTDFSSRRTH